MTLLPAGCQTSRRLTSLAPQPPHKPLELCRFPWSRAFDRIFRNEEVGGSNPPSSTERPGQGEFGEFVRSPDSTSCDLTLHRRPTRSALEAPLNLRGAFSLGLTSFINQLRDRFERISRGSTEGGPAPQIDDEPHSHRKSSLSTSHLTRGTGVRIPPATIRLPGRPSLLAEMRTGVSDTRMLMAGS